MHAVHSTETLLLPYRPPPGANPGDRKFRQPRFKNLKSRTKVIAGLNNITGELCVAESVKMRRYDNQYGDNRNSALTSS
jgi:hypothetical protein